jgi:hypothetical protein
MPPDSQQQWGGGYNKHTRRNQTECNATWKQQAWRVEQNQT